MNTKLITLIAAGVVAAGTVAQGAIVAELDFESPGGYTTSITEFSDSSEDFFIRTDGSNIGTAIEVTGAGGSFWFHGMDIDGEGATIPVTLNWTVDISGFSSLSFNFDVAEDDDGTNEDWDLADYVHVKYNLDGGGEQDLIWFESIPDGDSFNAVPALDTDFDGDGDGTTVTDTFANFSAPIAGTGSSLEIIVEFNLDSGDEDFAMDNLQITGVPEPSTYAAIVGLLGLGLVMIRRRLRK